MSVVWKDDLTPINAEDNLFGYRWVVDNSYNSIYIVKIKINGCYYKKPHGEELDYMTDDWTIVEITDAIHNISIERIEDKTHAIYSNNVDYYVGNHIIGEEVFFCLTIQDLQTSQHLSMKNCEKICLLPYKWQKEYVLDQLSAMYPGFSGNGINPLKYVHWLKYREQMIRETSTGAKDHNR